MPHSYKLDQLADKARRAYDSFSGANSLSWDELHELSRQTWRSVIISMLTELREPTTTMEEMPSSKVAAAIDERKQIIDAAIQMISRVARGNDDDLANMSDAQRVIVLTKRNTCLSIINGLLTIAHRQQEPEGDAP